MAISNIFNHKPLVSILINNYNYGHLIGAAIDSGLNQTYPHTEVIVVDDGSTDNSREIINSYGDRIISVLKENGGQASAFNVGFAASQGDITCLLDSDDIFLPDKVAEIVNIFRDYQDIDWCFHSLKLVDIKTNTFIKSSHNSLSQECDFRAHIRRGKRPFSPPATSGLCFTRSLLQLMLPMPEAKHISIGDHYLKFTALALSKGFFLGKDLAIQNIHNNNAYTLRGDNQPTKARIFILTAYWIRVKFPFLARFTNKLVAKGIALYCRTGEVEIEHNKLIKSYISFIGVFEKIEISFKVLFYYLFYSNT